jgi:adenylate cyclase
MSSQAFVITILILTALIVYLFVSAPPMLPEATRAGAILPIERVLPVVAAENDVTRALWTKEIVGAGQKVGLKFKEDWREKEVEAGPLPALFLRETAKSLEVNPVRLSLYLGSDFPINAANKFEGLQADRFQVIKTTREPQFFYAADTGLHTAMFPDVAVVQPCIDCHNDHKESPKNDWKLQDVMGATTWSYPAADVTLEEALALIGALRQGFRDAYSAYIEKTESFAKRPFIGDKWPRDGYFLPTVDVFLDEIGKRASPTTLQRLLALALRPSQRQPAPVSASSEGDPPLGEARERLREKNLFHFRAVGFFRAVEQSSGMAARGLIVMPGIELDRNRTHQEAL